MTQNPPPELADHAVRVELMALSADVLRLSPRNQQTVLAGLALLNGTGGPCEAADARPTKEGTLREHTTS